jgi:hypothetical protein
MGSMACFDRVQTPVSRSPRHFRLSPNSGGIADIAACLKHAISRSPVRRRPRPIYTRKPTYPMVTALWKVTAVREKGRDPRRCGRAAASTLVSQAGCCQLESIGDSQIVASGTGCRRPSGGQRVPARSPQATISRGDFRPAPSGGENTARYPPPPASLYVATAR